MKWKDRSRNLDIEMRALARNWRNKNIKGVPSYQVFYYAEDELVRRRVVINPQQEEIYYDNDSNVEED